MLSCLSPAQCRRCGVKQRQNEARAVHPRMRRLELKFQWVGARGFAVRILLSTGVLIVETQCNINQFLILWKSLLLQARFFSLRVAISSLLVLEVMFPQFPTSTRRLSSLSSNKYRTTSCASQVVIRNKQEMIMAFISDLCFSHSAFVQLDESKIACLNLGRWVKRQAQI